MASQFFFLGLGQKSWRDNSLGDRRPVDAEGLEELWPVADGLGMLHYHADRAGTGDNKK